MTNLHYDVIFRLQSALETLLATTLANLHITQLK